MAFCKNCGQSIDTSGGAKFCQNCGQSQQDTEQPDVQSNGGRMRTVTISRSNQFVGSAATLSVYIDGEEYALLRPGETKTFEVQHGSHRLQIRSNMSYIGLAGGQDSDKSDVAFINETDGDVCFLLKTSMGLVAGGNLQLIRVNPNEFGNNATGVQNAYDGTSQYAKQADVPPGYEQKSKLVAGLLQVFLGWLGVGRFYLGYTNIGIFQLLSTLCCGVGIIWGWVDAIMIFTGSVKVDAKGVVLKE